MITSRHKTRKAFSLIELLIASTIFALTLVIAFGAFSLTLGNQSFIQANSEVNIDGGRIIRQLSDDIINANGFGSVVGIDASRSYQKIKGFIFLSFDNSAVGSGIPSSSFGICYYREQINCDPSVNTLILFYKNPDQTKIYQWDQTTGELRLKTISGNSVTISTISLSGVDRINSPKVEVNHFGLTGATCSSALCKQQPYVGLDLGVRTKDYNSKPPAKRAKFYLQTRVESRIQ